MPDYKIYAVQLDHAFKEARKKYTEAYNLMLALKKEMEDIQGNPRLAETFGDHAEYKYKRAKAEFEKVEFSVWEDFDQRRKEIRASLESTFTKANQAKPEDIDRDGLKLLESGIMTLDELGAFLDRYEDNPTMQRLTAQHIKKMMEGEKDASIRQRFYTLYQRAGTDAVMDQWKGLEEAARICTGQAHGKGTPSYVLNISSKWEELTEKAVESF